MLEIQNFSVYTKCLRSGIKKKYPGIFSFVLTTEQRSKCGTLALSILPYFVQTQINNQTYINRETDSNIQIERDIEEFIVRYRRTKSNS